MYSADSRTIAGRSWGRLLWVIVVTACSGDMNDAGPDAHCSVGDGGAYDRGAYDTPDSTADAPHRTHSFLSFERIINTLCEPQTRCVEHVTIGADCSFVYSYKDETRHAQLSNDDCRSFRDLLGGESAWSFFGNSEPCGVVVTPDFVRSTVVLYNEQPSTEKEIRVDCHEMALDEADMALRAFIARYGT